MIPHPTAPQACFDFTWVCFCSVFPLFFLLFCLFPVFLLGSYVFPLFFVFFSQLYQQPTIPTSKSCYDPRVYDLLPAYQSNLKTRTWLHCSNIINNLGVLPFLQFNRENINEKNSTPAIGCKCHINSSRLIQNIDRAQY